MDCIEITNSQLLVTHFRNGDPVHLNKVFKCFFNSFFEDFRRLAFKYCQNKNHTKYKEEELARDAFNDGLMSFYLKLKNEGFEEKGAQVKTVFFTFCIFKLRAAIKSSGGRFVKETSVDPDVLFDGRAGAGAEESTTAKEHQQLLDAKEEILDKAIHDLGERGANLITWKKILKLKNEEIAYRMSIQPNTVPNEVYKSFCKLKEIAERLQSELI